MGLSTEFKEFAMKGNVVDLAVGVIIGAAFGKIVSSLVGDIFMPTLGKFIGGINFSDLAITLGKDPTGKEVLIKYGAFAQTIFDFIIIALVLFLALMVEVHTNLDVVSDADDNRVLAGAVDGRSDFLVTGDPHLLALQQYEGCKIVSPDKFLAVLQKEEQTD